MHGAGSPLLVQNPLASSLDVLIHQHAQVQEDEPADVEAEKLRCVSSAQLKSDLSLVGMAQAGIFHLAGNLICKSVREYLVKMEGLESPAASRIEAKKARLYES